MVEPVTCIFPHGDELPTPAKLRDYLYELRKLEKGQYLCGKLGFRDKDLKEKLIPGSLVLFRKLGVIVGKATTKTTFHKFEIPVKAKTETGEEAEYSHEIYFRPGSIKVYPKALPIEQIESWAGRNLRQQYYLILPGTRRDFEKAFPNC